MIDKKHIFNGKVWIAMVQDSHQPCYNNDLEEIIIFE